MHHSRTSRGLLVAVCLVATLFATGSAAAGTGHAVRASDAAAPGGRLIVFWKPGHRTDVADARIASASIVRGHAAKHSLIVARPGRPGRWRPRLRADPDIAAVVPDSRMRVDAWPTSGAPNDPAYATQQHDLPLIGVPTAWQTTTGSPSVIVAILDTGTTIGHEDLAGTTFVSPDNEVAGGTAVVDDHGHGTHVTGTIAARTNNGIGVAGIAPGVSIMPVKVLDATGGGYLSAILDGIDHAVVNGAKIINLSLGGTIEPDAVAAIQPTFDAAFAAGVTIIAAAGNDGDTSIEYPCAFVHVICVGATDDSDLHASFSNRNAFVDISAPGVDQLSTAVGGGYAHMSGTSMATPHVVGVAALILSAHPGDTPSQIEAALESTAHDYGSVGRDDSYGYGRVDAGAAVAVVPPPGPPADLTPPTMTTLTAPSLITSTDGSFTVAFKGSDNVGVVGYQVMVRHGATGTWSAPSIQIATTKTFSGLAPGTWYVDVRTRDAAGNLSAWKQVHVVVPADDRSYKFSARHAPPDELGLSPPHGHQDVDHRIEDDGQVQRQRVLSLRHDRASPTGGCGSPSMA